MKLLLIILTFLSLLAPLRADGELTVLLTPDSLNWSGDDPLTSASLSEVLMATQGYAVGGRNDWSGLSIKDPFALGQMVLIVLHVQGVYNVPTLASLNRYDLVHSYTNSALDSFVAQLEPGRVQNLSFYDHDIGVAKCQRLLQEIDVPMAEPIRYLQPLEYKNHRNFLIELGYVRAIAGNLTQLAKGFSVLVIRISLERIVRAQKNVLLHEAKTLLAKALDQLMQSARNLTDNVLLLMTTDRYQLISGASLRGEFTSVNQSNPFGEFQSVDYPVIFNIVLWFGLVMAFWLAVICYVIATIDPGRDSMIYRIGRTHKNQSIAKKQR